MHEAVDALRVAYTGALHVPLCLGSVAVPLHNSHYNDYYNNKDDGSRSRSATASAAATSSHRCTHKRYCYVRDGASLDEDAFYRWLYAHTYTDATQSTATTTTAAAAAATTPSAVNASHSRTRKRTRSTAASHTRRAAHGDVHDDSKKRSDAHDDDATADNDNDANDESDNDDDDEEDETTQPATERDAALPVRSPSLLYALIDHVVFVLPRSFAQPRRVLYAPPFVIEDDTWAPHMVEVTLYFAAALAVAPVTLSHHVLLQPHCEIAPQLRAMTYGQAKPPTLVLLPPSPARTTTTTTTPPSSASSHTKDNDGHAAVADAQDAAVHASARGSNKDSSDARTVAAAAAVTQLVVSERKDSLRVVHPSVPLLRFVARVLRVARGVTVSQLRRFFVEHVTCSATNTTSAAARQSTRDDGDGDAVVMRWRLPYEEHIAAHAHERAARAQRALQTTAAALHDEQACLWRSCDTAVRDTAALVQQLNDALDAMHTACVQLADRPSLAP